MGFLSLLDLNVLKNWLRLERISLCSSGPSPSPLSLCQEDEFVFWCVFPLSPPFHILLKWALSWFSITSWFRIIKDNDKEQMVLSHPEAHYWIDRCKFTQATSLSIAPGDQVNSPYSWGSRWGPPSPWALVGHPGCPVSFLFLWTPTGWLPIWPMCWAPSFTVQNW